MTPSYYINYSPTYTATSASTTWPDNIIYSFTNSSNYYTSYDKSFYKGTTSTGCNYDSIYKWVDVTEDWIVRPKLNPRSRLREIMTARQGPAVHVKASKYYNPEDNREVRARETLRRVVGESNYRYFLRTGFINVRGKSGILYRICRGHMVDAWKDGKCIEQLCVYLKGDFTPADELITKFLMIINNEDQFRAVANISRGHREARNRSSVVDSRSLPEILKELKAA